MKYTVEVGGRSFEVEVEGGRVSLDGKPVETRLSGIAGSAVRSLSNGRRNRPILAQPGEGGQWTLALGGCRLNVSVLDARGRALKNAGVRSGGRGGTGTLKAPMPGLVLRVLVAVGVAVEAGQGLLVIEAMKMENELKAQGAGTVKQVHVAPGARVEKGAPLLELG